MVEEPDYEPAAPFPLQAALSLAFIAAPILGLAGGVTLVFLMSAGSFGLGYAFADAFGSNSCAPAAATNALGAALCGLQAAGWYLLFRFRRLGTAEPQALFSLFAASLAIGMLPSFFILTTVPYLVRCAMNPQAL